MGKYSYLILDILVILFPFLLSFDKKVAFYKQWKSVFKGLFVGGTVFLIWDHFFAVNGIWSFNSEYITGLHIFSLPVEEVLFFLVVPYSCIFIFSCVRAYFPALEKKSFAKPVWWIIALFSLIMVIIYHDRTYTLVTFILLLLLSILFALKSKAWHQSFLIAYIISLIPFFMVNGILTATPIVLYNDLETVGFRWGSIPFEDSFYMLALLMLNVWVMMRSKGLR